MRKLLISLMAATMLVPAAASAEDGAITRSMRAHAERSDHGDNRSDNRSERSQSSQRVERSSNDRPARAERVQRGERSFTATNVERRDRGDGRRVERARRWDRNTQVEQGQQVEQNQQVEQVQRVHRSERDRTGISRVLRRVEDRDNGVRVVSTDGREWRRDRDRDHNWSRHWRNDRRYNWSSYRYRYGSLYRLGRYYDPYGWNYRRTSIGFNLGPSYYGSNYWLDDPWHYRLPPAYGPYRWVRYYDDALLVNIYTGQVVDVVYNIFW